MCPLVPHENNHPTYNLNGRSQRTKSKRATQQRVSSRRNLNSSDDDSAYYTSDSESDTDNEKDHPRIEQIIAYHKDTRKNWNCRFEKMNTSVIDNGSRLLEMYNLDNCNDDNLEERYLVKWAGLSFMHCSWE